MSGAGTIIFNPMVVTAIAAAGVGFAAFWANPTRVINRAFFSASMHVAVWLGMLYLATTIHEGLIWLRAASAFGAFFPLQLWLIKDSIVSKGETLPQIFWRRRWWVLGFRTGLSRRIPARLRGRLKFMARGIMSITSAWCRCMGGCAGRRFGKCRHRRA